MQQCSRSLLKAVQNQLLDCLERTCRHADLENENAYYVAICFEETTHIAIKQLEK
jgi:hypothetical protein